ncbi:MAG TPA: hypothetical protein DF364_04780 [Ruminococcaceae bacterium]|nr:hypothetical protein [Oscillospiraceae bacterium]
MRKTKEIGARSFFRFATASKKSGLENHAAFNVSVCLSAFPFPGKSFYSLTAFSICRKMRKYAFLFLVKMLQFNWIYFSFVIFASLF